MSKYEELLECARAWEPGVRLLGNVTAATIAEICLEAIQLRADLATVTAERDEARGYWDGWMRDSIIKTAAHDETKAALELAQAWEARDRRVIGKLRADLAAAEARVKELEAELLDSYNDNRELRRRNAELEPL